MDPHERFSLSVIVALAVALLIVLLLRVHEGRCREGGWKGGLDCTYPAPALSTPP